MALEVNPHVSRLRRFQPFHPDSAELVFEQTDPTQPSFEVATYRYLVGAVEDSSTRLIVLTGDAGHGKTTLCARVLSDHLGIEKLAAQRLIQTHGNGSAPAAQTNSGRDLFIISDLSAVSISHGSNLLRELLSSDRSGVAIVCANEGRLRSCVSRDQTGETRTITRTLEAGIEQGVVSDAGGIHVVNLNYQSVAPNHPDGLVDWTLRQFATDGRSWRPCVRCDAKAVCPIFANHRALADEGKGAARRQAFRATFSAAERTGAVITTRQTMALVSYAVTGGMVCEDVHKRFRREPAARSWQYSHLYHQALFGDRLTAQERAQVPAVSALRRLDPGQVARRDVDDYLDPATATTDFLPKMPGSDDDLRPRTRRDAQRESQLIHGAMAFLRRLDYFESDSEDRFARLGLEAGDDFVAIASAEQGASTGVRDRILRGLEAIQGFHRAGESPDFLVLDPAFFVHRTRAAVISRRIPSRQIRVVDQPSHWRESRGSDDESKLLPQAVEWLNRAVFVRMPTTNGGTVAIQLDLLGLELLSRWAEGLRSRNQHEAEIRGITSMLAVLAAEAGSDDEIHVLVGGERRSLMIDTGEKIRAGSN